MDIRNRRGLKAAARESLAKATCDPKKLILIHTLVSVALALVITALDFVVGTRIEDTGGLGGMDLRSILSTAQSVLRLANLVFLPFWELGYIYAAMGIARGKDVKPANLLEGFRHWGVVLRANLLQLMLYLCTGFSSFYLAMMIFMFTPLSNGLYQVVAPYGDDPTVVLTDPTLMAAAYDATLPMMLIFLGLCVLLVLPMVYHYRMVNYALLDDPKAGAFAALRRSKVLMYRNRFRLLKLDLSFWWFYAAQALLSLVCYGDVILAMLGVTLPFSGTISFFAFYALSLVFQLVLFVLLRNRVAVTYAHAYEALAGAPREVPPQPVQPRNQPWEY